jgi:hypothetical protein
LRGSTAAAVGVSDSDASSGAHSVPQLLRELDHVTTSCKPPAQHTERERQLPLRQADAATAALPLRTLCCNNSGRVNLSGLCDLHLVAGKGLCAHCGAARYCSKACQMAHWPAHKDKCAWLPPLP